MDSNICTRIDLLYMYRDENIYCINCNHTVLIPFAMV